MTNGGLFIVHRYKVQLRGIFEIVHFVPFHVFTINRSIGFCDVNVVCGTSDTLASPSAINATKWTHPTWESRSRICCKCSIAFDMRHNLSSASTISSKSSSSLRSTRSSEAKDVGFDSSSNVVPSSAVPLLGGDCDVVEDKSESESE